MGKEKLEVFFTSQFEEHIMVAKKTENSTYKVFKNCLAICVKALKKGKKIIIFGNGGSASDAQHIAAELVVRFSKNRKPIPALAITTDTSALTAIGNDFGFEYLFSRQIEAIGNKEDVAIGISTSGKSKNVILALKKSKEVKMKTISFCGKYVKEVEEFSDEIISIPAINTSRIQEMHITIGQMLCNAIEESMKLAPFVVSEK